MGLKVLIKYSLYQFLFFKSNSFIFSLNYHYLFSSAIYADNKKSKRKESEMQDLAAANESYDIKDLEDEFKGHDIKVFNL
jgi:hypothetical protein